MADEPIADLVARVLARPVSYGAHGVTLAREVARLQQAIRDDLRLAEIQRDEVARLTEERDAAGWVAAEAEAEVARLRDGIEALACRCEPECGSNVSSIYAWVATQLRALLSPATQGEEP